MKEEKMQESFVGQWVNNQKKLVEYYQNNSLSRSYIDMYNSWYESVSDIYKKNYSKFVEKNDYFDINNTLVTAEKAYSNLKRFYENILENVSYKDISTENIKMFQENTEEYIKYLSINFIPYLPKPIQEIFAEALQIQRIFIKGTEELYQSLYNNSKELQSIVFKSMLGDKDAAFKYMNYWNENWKKSIKTMMAFPKVITNNELYDMQIKSINNYISYNNSLIEFNEKLLKVGYDCMEETIEKYQSLIEKGLQDTTFEDFYTFWWKLNEKAYKELFNSSEFIDLTDKVTEAINEFKSNYENIIDMQLNMQPFATKKDLEGIKEVIGKSRKK
ncbi:poly(R)-hydroxyalkanoic acid synthase subunit PhaE [Serpentinicella alkaliphila]|uniref:Poly(3-hydroxyalkanoate) polymerase subunit PhaE n=1 Tax=Serpentinicella alkaliphila TaxID=1734049 RepID=A0A4R2TK74_9FIRM|nr:poly(R)-hydroxyalkanoic acid synthase subunit PhaE [Serpentinicella alkaliphila]QUH24756.1 hypothetical protein HZR23_02395 [Serpentinicella alkaliphila]TCQ03751.1 poly(hydroxyalkanoate) synthase III subunit E [Serpentinicella alkaliphila]